MSQAVRNDSLDNFETNRDQDLGKAIADAAFALSQGGTGSDKTNAHDDIQHIHTSKQKHEQALQRKR